MRPAPLLEAVSALAAACERLGLPSADLRAARDRLEAGVFDVLVAGAFKRGKSTLVNALLGGEVVPMGVTPVTNVPALLAHGSAPRGTVHFADGRQLPICLEDVRGYMAEAHNPGNIKQVAYVEIAYPADLLRHGLRLVDTPGVGSVFAHQTEAAKAALPKADAAILVLTVDPPIGADELAFLQDVKPVTGRVFVALNKVDLMSAAERDEALAFTRAVLARELDQTPAIFPVSARTALNEAQTGGVGSSSASGLAELRSALESLMTQERAVVQEAAIQKAIQRAVAVIQREIDLRRHALEVPPRELAAQLGAFAAAGQDLARQQREAALVLDAEGRDLMRGVNDDLARLKERLHPQVLAAFNEAAQAISGRNGSDLNAAFEQAGRRVIEQAIERWRAEAEPKLWAQVDALTTTYTTRVDGLVERLFAISRDLFGLPGLAADPPERHGEPPAFEFRWVEHVPTASGMVARALVGSLPANLARPFVARASRARVAFLLDVQLGWLRHDLDRRVTAWTKSLRDHVDVRLAAACDGIEGALERGSKARDAGAEVLASQLAELADVETLVKRYAAPQ